MEKKTLDHLRPTTNNPRIVMKDNSEKLDRSLDEYGPMDGIIMNVNPAINELVGGNQRTTKFRIAGAKAVITKRFDEPTHTGTVAYGFVDLDGEQHPYREVKWDSAKHKKGIALANQHVGTNDNDLLAELYQDIALEDPDYTDELFITEEEVVGLQDGYVEHTEDGPKVPEPKEQRWTIDDLRREREKFYNATKLDDGGFVEFLAKK